MTSSSLVRTGIGLVVAAVAMFTCAPAAYGSSSATPVLGHVYAPNQQGWGTAHPATIYDGGDTTGLVSSIVWRQWGASTATGTGSGCHIRSGATSATCIEETAIVVATGLGSCGGKRAYRYVGWYFPAEHENPRSSLVEGCLSDSAMRAAPVMGGPRFLPGTTIRLEGTGEVRPRTVRFNTEASTTRLHWTSWGAATAVGRGRFCGEGDCSQGTYFLSHLGVCGGEKAYEDTYVQAGGHRYYDIRNCLFISG